MMAYVFPVPALASTSVVPGVSGTVSASKVSVMRGYGVPGTRDGGARARARPWPTAPPGARTPPPRLWRQRPHPRAYPVPRPVYPPLYPSSIAAKTGPQSNRAQRSKANDMEWSGSRRR